MEISVPQPRDLFLARFFNVVYAWMAVGLLLTGTIAYGISTSHLATTVTSGFVLWPVVIVQLLLVFAITRAGDGPGSMDAGLATVLFLVYAALNGLMLSSVFLLYTKANIAAALLITSGTFGGMSVVGMVTKKDMSSWGGVLFMLLLGLLVALAVNIVLGSSFFQWIINIAGVVIFVALTAYDTQRLKELALEYQGDGSSLGGLAINGSLALYLDFINLLLFILDLLGSKE
jgi:FtsH-binding integral membrane protein